MAPLVGWSDAEKVALLFSIIDASQVKIDWSKVDTQGRTVKACRHVMAKLRSECGKQKVNGEHCSPGPSSESAGSSNGKKRSASKIESQDEDATRLAKKSKTKKEKAVNGVVAIKDEPTEQEGVQFYA